MATIRTRFFDLGVLLTFALTDVTADVEGLSESGLYVRLTDKSRNSFGGHYMLTYEILTLEGDNVVATVAVDAISRFHWAIAGITKHT